MPTLTYHTAGESHGPAVTCLIYGLPGGLELDVEFINRELKRRQGGYGRGRRQRIESDAVTFLGLPYAMMNRSSSATISRGVSSFIDRVW